jgi:isopentenyl phosphate kinase
MDEMEKSQTSPTNLQFLKLGGSLITDKTRPHTLHPDVIARLAEEIKTCRQEFKNLHLLLGHGSGSFGHVPAQRHGTRQGVTSAEGWHGFAEVWFEATTLNCIVMEALHAVELPAISFPASASATTRDGQVLTWDLAPIKAAFRANLLPVVYGDVVFDTVRGGTILSTEDIFTHLARQLSPQRILLAGSEEGVWADFPQCTQLIPEITPGNWEAIAAALAGASATDVTGGMRSKVRTMLTLTTEIPGLEVLIFNGHKPGNLLAALQGASLGTRISSS